MTKRTYSTRGHLRDPEVRNHFVYRLFDADGVLMYVGCSVRPMQRIKEHREMRADMVARIASIKIQGPYTYQKARELEYVATNTENPTENCFTPANVKARTERNRAFDRSMQRHLDRGATLNDAAMAALDEVDSGVSA